MTALMQGQGQAKDEAAEHLQSCEGGADGLAP